MKREVISWIIAVICFSILFSLINVSGTNSSTKNSITIKDIQEFNNGLSNQKLILPNQFGYSTKIFFEDTRLFFTFTLIGRLKYELELADKRIAETKSLIEQNSDKRYIDTSISKYKSIFLEVGDTLTLLKTDGRDYTELEEKAKDSITKQEVALNLMKSNNNYISQLDDVEAFIKDSNLSTSANVDELANSVRQNSDDLNNNHEENGQADARETDNYSNITQEGENSSIQNQTYIPNNQTPSTNNTTSANQTPTNQTPSTNNTTSANHTSASSFCNDSDGRNYFKKGYVSDSHSQGIQIPDECIIFLSPTSTGWQQSNSCSITDTRCSVREGLCDNPTTPDFYYFENYECPGGCSDGACLAINSCIESDNGENYLKQGKITSKEGISYYDYCSDSKTLVEYYCSENSVLTKNYICDNGCVNGACIDDNPLSLYLTKLYNMSSDNYQGSISLYVQYGNGVNDNVYLGFIPTYGNIYKSFSTNENNIRGAVYLSVNKNASASIAQQTITITSDTGINKAYLPQIGSTQFTSIRFYVAKDGSTYWALRNHGLSGTFQSEFMNISEAFQPIHLARPAPS